MSIMNVELYDALKNAGADEEKARSAAGSVGDANQLATKSDISVLKTDISDLKTRMDAGFKYLGLILGYVVVAVTSIGIYLLNKVG